jgi:hypothetical protein
MPMPMPMPLSLPVLPPIAPPPASQPSLLGDWRRALMQSLPAGPGPSPGASACASLRTSSSTNSLDADAGADANGHSGSGVNGVNGHANGALPGPSVPDRLDAAGEARAVCAWFLRNVVDKNHRLPRTRSGLVQALRCNYKVRGMAPEELAAALESLHHFHESSDDGASEPCISWGVRTMRSLAEAVA